jgi:hypothetical protein
MLMKLDMEVVAGDAIDLAIICKTLFTVQKCFYFSYSPPLEAQIMETSALHGQLMQHHNPSPPVRFVVEFKAFLPGSFGSWLPEPGPPRPLKVFEFKTDERAFNEPGTSRVYSRATIATDPASPDGRLTMVDHDPKCDASHRRGRYKWSSVWQYETRPANPDGDEKFDDYSYRLIFSAKAGYPFSIIAKIFAKINYTVVWTFVLDNSNWNIHLSGWHDRFPAYEAIFNNTIIYQYEPKCKGPTLFNLNRRKTIVATPRQIENTIFIV